MFGGTLSLTQSIPVTTGASCEWNCRPVGSSLKHSDIIVDIGYCTPHYCAVLQYTVFIALGITPNLLEFFSSWKSAGNLQCVLEVVCVYLFVVSE